MADMGRIKAELMAGWNGLIAGGCLTYDEMTDCLLDQVTGSLDMSADELTDDLAEMMGWDPSAMTDDQWTTWRHIVDQAASEYLSE